VWTIEELREARGWSRQELAERAGVTRMAIWHWENGSRIPRFDQMRVIARVLEVSLDDIRLPGDTEVASRPSTQP
jgi:transcriptional regulator with XRE-family HTH domain